MNSSKPAASAAAWCCRSTDPVAEVFQRFVALALFLPALATAVPTAGPTAAAPPVLDIGATRYLGLHQFDGDVEAFLGLPFAEPPVGERRWRPPEVIAPRAGTVIAQGPAPACLQGGYMAAWYEDLAAGFGAPPESIDAPPEREDCLYLNVWRPRERAETPLPVLVFIHGGANAGGWSWEPNYDGARLASRGLLVVTVAYRVGVFGFFSHPALEHANYGLLDQVAALEWVHRHAEALGADPRRVTVMGESSGGNNIIHLLVSPLAEGLFRRAAVQSAGWALQGAPRKADQEALGLELQAELLAAHQADGEGAPREAPIDADALAAMRRLPAATVFDAAQEVYADHFFDPVIDGRSVLEPVADSVAAGRFSPVDLLIGSNADEWRMYLAEDASLDDWASEGLPPAARPSVARRLGEEEDPRRALDRAVTAYQMLCPSLALADAVRQRDGRSWAYWFTRQRPGARGAELGAYHGAELPYLFDTHDPWLPTDSADRSLTEHLMGYWVRFVQSGDPNTVGAGASAPRWPPYAGGGRVLRLDTDLRPVHHPDWPLCAALRVGATEMPRQ